MADHDYRDGGLRPKYRVAKADGSPLDEGADYFVLRLDADPHARAAALAYADAVQAENARLADDLRLRVASYEPGFRAASESLRRQGF
ncbi:MAG TPA: hypothetical protein VD838_01425 [Anaeromyxobacteraceae bacterium]|nr:hypothetical protein [Anaeromyxobacteraceae bacterium]